MVVQETGVIIEPKPYALLTSDAFMVDFEPTLVLHVVVLFAYKCLARKMHESSESVCVVALHEPSKLAQREIVETVVGVGVGCLVLTAICTLHADTATADTSSGVTELADKFSIGVSPDVRGQSCIVQSGDVPHVQETTGMDALWVLRHQIELALHIRPQDDKGAMCLCKAMQLVLSPTLMNGGYRVSSCVVETWFEPVRLIQLVYDGQVS